VATQDKWLAHGLDPESKSQRVANYVRTLRRDLLKVSEAAGVEHPALVGPETIEVLETLSEGRRLDEIYGYKPGWGLPAEEDRAALVSLMEAHEEAEVQTEGPPETAEPGARGEELTGSQPVSE
jgi:glutamate synthase (ferredoxin)